MSHLVTVGIIEGGGTSVSRGKKKYRGKQRALLSNVEKLLVRLGDMDQGELAKASFTDSVPKLVLPATADSNAWGRTLQRVRDALIATA